MTGDRRPSTLGGLRGKRPDIQDLPVSEDVRLEMEAHIAMETESLMGEGMSEPEAREEALRRFGELDRYQKEAEQFTRAHDRAVHRSRIWEGLRQDLGYALRRLKRSPGFAALAVLTLALGIGANTAVFSLVNGVLLAPLPYGDPGRLVAVNEEHEGGRAGPIPWPNYQDWRTQARSFTGFAVHSSGTTRIVGTEEPARARLASVSEDFFSVMQVAPLEGRLTLPMDHRLGATPVALVGERFWATHLASDPNVLGRVLGIGGRSVQVIGVLPRTFDFPGDADVWIPLELAEQSPSRTAHNYAGVARLGPDVTPARADVELDEITRLMGQSLGAEEFDAVGGIVTPLKEAVAGSAQRPLLLLMGASLLVLLIACVNLGSTLLARGAARETEMAVRTSLGAQRGRLVRQLLTESLVLALFGGAAAVVVALLINRTTLQLAGGMVPRLSEVSLDARVLGFTLLVSVLTGVLFGLFPAFSQLRANLASALRSGTRAGETRKSITTWRLLIGIEVALALVLLVGSGLLLRSFAEIRAQEVGVSASRVIAADIALDRQLVTNPEEAAVRYAEILAEAASAPSIEAVGIANTYPISGGMGNGQVELDGDLSKTVYGWYVTASPGYFEALEIPLLQGRMFDARDTEGSGHVAVVSESFAELAWPGENPVGRQVTGGGMDNFWEERPFATVVGVVGDVRYRGLGQEPEPVYYFPLAQRPFRAFFGATVVARSRTADAVQATSEMREILRRADPQLAPRVRMLAAEINGSVADRRFTMAVLIGFAGLALLLALIGIHGVVSYRVSRRTREMGVRMALGARRDQVLGLVMRDALGMVLWGMLFGLVLALLGGSVLRSLLFGVEARDPLTFLIALPVLSLGALIAVILPARRAMRVDPTVAMRAE